MPIVHRVLCRSDHDGHKKGLILPSVVSDIEIPAQDDQSLGDEGWVKVNTEEAKTAGKFKRAKEGRWW